MSLEQFILYVIPTPLLFLLVVGGSAALSVGSLLLVRRFVPHHRLKQHNDVTGSVFATVGVLYAVLLGFMVIAVWQSFDYASANVEKEANCLMDLYRDSVAFSPEFKKELCALIQDYTKGVVDYEWKAMASGNHSSRVTKIMDKIWNAYSAYSPKNPTEQAFFQESIKKLNDLGEARRSRLLNAVTGIHPILWMVLLVGGAVTMTFISFFGAESLKTQTTMALMLSVLVGIILFTILAMDYPFTGSISITTEAFKPIVACIR